MEDNQLKMKKHPILDCPYLGPALLFTYGNLAYDIPGAITYGSSLRKFSYLIMALAGIAMIIIHYYWFKGEYKGGFCTAFLKDKSIWELFITLVIMDSIVCIYDIFMNAFAGITFEGFSTSLMAAICEETVMRLILMSIMMRRYKDKKSYLPVLLVSSFLFGISHYSNITGAVNFWTVTIQAISATCSGIAMGAIFLRTGNIGLSMSWHFLHNFLCSMSLTAVQDQIIAGVTRLDMIECIMLCIIYIIFAVILLKGHKEEIMDLWKKQWPYARLN